MSWVSQFAHWAEGKLKALWTSVSPKIKADLEAAAAAAGNDALAFVKAEAAKVVSGQIKLNNVAALLIDAKGAAKTAGFTIALDAAKAIGQDVYLTVEQTGPSPQTLVATPDDPQDVHDQIAAANAATIANWVATGQISPDVAAQLTPVAAGK